MRVIGTAGHVDHGKSTLIHALTGIDPDRLKEEKEREMTIDLGFAWLTLPSGREVSIVDVPGHEDFVRNMLAGVGGIDLALLVVAADEGAMPQTREHLAILDLLKISDGIVVLTKSDLIEDPEWLDLVKEEVRDELAGSVLQDAKILPVSARTGQGLAELLAELDGLLQRPLKRRETGRPRLPIDRVFTIGGFGTVITGTLIEGRLQTGQEVTILPGGIRARIRGLQTHKLKVETAIPPSRVAVNLAGVDRDQLQRGNVLTTPGWLRPTSLLDARLRMLKSIPRPLANNTTVHFFAGTAQCQARVRILDRKEIAPGDQSWVQLALSTPVAVLKGDHFIIRQPSPSQTLGGGSIVNPFPQRRHRRFRPEVLQRLELLTHGTPEQILLLELEHDQPCEAAALVRNSTLVPEKAALALSSLLGTGQAVLLNPSGKGPDSAPDSTEYVISASGWQNLIERMSAVLHQHHRRFPLRAGISREELKSRLRLAPRAFNETVSRAVSQGALRETETIVFLAEHQVTFSPEQQRTIAELVKAFRQRPHSPPSLAKCEALVGADVLAALLERGDLVKVSDSVLFSASAYREMIQAIIDQLQHDGHITLAQIRDMFSTSRKYAQALIEHLDDKHVTRRVGDKRVLR